MHQVQVIIAGAKLRDVSYSPKHVVSCLVAWACFYSSARYEAYQQVVRPVLRGEGGEGSAVLLSNLLYGHRSCMLCCAEVAVLREVQPALEF